MILDMASCAILFAIDFPTQVPLFSALPSSDNDDKLDDIRDFDDTFLVKTTNHFPPAVLIYAILWHSSWLINNI